MDESAAATALGVTKRQLRSIERGRRAVTPAIVERAVGAYGGGLDLPPRQDLVHPTDPATLVVGDELIPVDLARHDNRTLLSRYLTAVRRQRGLGPKDPVAFRTADVVALAGVLDLGAEDLEQQLRSLAGMNGATARRTAQALVLTGLCVLALGGASLRLSSGGGPGSVSASGPIGAGVAAEVLDRGPAIEVPGPAALAGTEVRSTVPTTASPFTVVARDRPDPGRQMFTTTPSARSGATTPTGTDRPAGMWSTGTPPATSGAVAPAPGTPALAPPPGGEGVIGVPTVG